MKCDQLVLRPYQQEAISDTEAQIAFGSENLVLSAETSWGKGTYIAQLAKNYEQQGVLILVNIEPLIDQIKVFLDLLDVDYSILKAGREKEFDATKPVQLVMSQTLYSRIDKIDFKQNFYMSIQDELHIEFDTKRTNAIFDKINPTIKIGCTATPFDSYGYALKDTDVIETATTQSLTNEGHLSPLKYFVPKWSERVDYSKVKKSGADYSMNSLDEIIGSEKHINQVIESMNYMNAKDKKTIIFCSTISMCNKMEKARIKDGYMQKHIIQKYLKKIILI